MKRSRSLFGMGLPLCISLVLGVGGGGCAGESTEPAVTTIAFGSCSKQRKGQEQAVWGKILAEKPQLFLFMGDNVYADTTDMDVMRRKYQKLADQPGYKKLRESCKVLAAWDDHDYGANDAGADYPMREQSQKVFLEFFDFPKDAPQWSRPGIYSSHYFGPEGKRLQVIMLDTRYFRSPLIRNLERGKGNASQYLPNTKPGATILGEAQWKWLAGELSKPADLRVIVSSIQIIPDEHFYEKWSNFPKERSRLIDLIKEKRAGGVVLLSGDRHLGEISRLPAVGRVNAGYALTEITSSGLSEGSGNTNEINRYRVGPSNYCRPNYGLIKIDWDAAGGPVATAGIKTIEGEPVFDVKLPLAELQPGSRGG